LAHAIWALAGNYVFLAVAFTKTPRTAHAMYGAFDAPSSLLAFGGRDCIRRQLRGRGAPLPIDEKHAFGEGGGVRNDPGGRIPQSKGGLPCPLRRASRKYIEACERGQVSRDTVHRWMQEPGFRSELERQRAELVDQGFALLSQNVSAAVEGLVGLLDNGDARLKRLACKDILDQHHKFREMDELTKRIEAIEEKLQEGT